MIIGTSVGIEISGRDLRISVLKSTFGKLALVRQLSLPGFLEMPAEEQKAAVQKLVKTHKLPNSRVFLSLPHDTGILRQLEFPLELKDKLKAAVELQIETLSPWPVDDIYWDFAHHAGVRSLSVLVAILPRIALDGWIQFFKSAGLPLAGASLTPLAHAHGSTAVWKDNTPTLVLTCEEGYVEGSLLQDGRIGSVTVKGDDTRSQARTVVERLLSSARIASPESVRLIVYGHSAGELEESVQPVSLPIENWRPDTEKFGAAAAALLGLRRTGFGSNLIPRSIRHRRSQLQLIPTYVLLGLTILLGAGLFLREPYQSMLYANSIEHEIGMVAPEVREVASQESELNALSEKYRALSRHFQNRDLNLEALRELAVILPSSAWLGSYNYQDGNITLSGFAESAAEVQKLLEDSPVFKDVQFTSSLTRESNGKDRFNLRASIEVSR